jgi:hypothetical protein
LIGQFYLRLKFNPKSELNKNQQVCLAEDPGSRWGGIAVLSKRQVLTCGMLVLPRKVAEKLKQRQLDKSAKSLLCAVELESLFVMMFRGGWVQR